jgi:flagellin
MRINHNIQALNAYSNLSRNQFSSSKVMEKLASGLRINRAADDAAGLAISEKMRGQIRGINQAERNSLDGISLIQTAEGALGEVQDMLQRMRELAVQAANGTNTDEDRAAIQKEINQLTSEINRVGNATEFNTQRLLNGGLLNVATVKKGDELSTPAVAGIYKFTVSTLPVGGEFEISGQIISIQPNGATVDGNNILAGTDAADQAKKLETAIKANAALNAAYDVVASGATITLTQKAGHEFSLPPDVGARMVKGMGLTQNLQIGANEGQNFMFSIKDMRSQALGISSTKPGATVSGGTFSIEKNVNNGISQKYTEYALDVLTTESASKAITAFERAISKVSEQRSILGSYQNRLEHTINNLKTTSENLTASESRIRDADMAKEMTEFTKLNIINQSATAMLAQANQLPQGVLQLLKG